MMPAMSETTLAELEHDPHPLLARLRAVEPVSWVAPLGGWVVSRRDLVLAVMRDAATFTVDDPRFSTARVVGPSMLSLDGDEHARHRDPFVRPFRLAEVRATFTASTEVEVDRLLAALRPAGAGELRRSFAGPLSVAVVAQALGLVDTEPATVLGWYDAIVDAVSGVSVGRTVSAAGAEAFGALRENVELALARPAGSSLLAAAAAAGLLTPDEVVSNAAVLMFGGIETTEGMIANALLHLLSHRDQLQLVLDDPTLVGAAIEESLRLEPAAAVIDRYATRDVEIGGAPVREGDLVIVSIAGANRDPAVFPEPDRFDVLRPDLKLQVAFAHGPHVCPGMHLARLEAQIAVRRALAALPGLRLDPDRPSAPRGLVFRKPPRLDVLWNHETPALRSCSQAS
jgi:cytochrome P450